MNDDRESYGFTWPGKRGAILEAGRPTDKVLRPVLSESVNFSGTENVYIEGDNLEALKILLKGYMRRRITPGAISFTGTISRSVRRRGKGSWDLRTRTGGITAQRFTGTTRRATPAFIRTGAA